MLIGRYATVGRLACDIRWRSFRFGDDPLDKPSGLLEEATRQVRFAPGALTILRCGQRPELNGSDTSDK